MRNSAASSCRCESPPLVNLFMHFPRFDLCRGYICAVVSYWHAFTYYREAADDPNSRASSQASRKDKEAGISAQFFSRWQFKEHKRREKEKMMAVSFCVVFFSVRRHTKRLWKLSFWGQKIIVTFAGILVHLKIYVPIFPVIFRFTWGRHAHEIRSTDAAVW